MHIYIPVVGILQILAIYMIVGWILYFPLYRWQGRFLGGRNNKSKSWCADTRKTLYKGILVSAVAWPIILGYNIKTEISYRKKGYL